MTNHVETRLAARSYDLAEERESFRRGYSDGFSGNPKGWRMNQNYSCSYNAGYWEGVADRGEPDEAEKLGEEMDRHGMFDYKDDGE